MKFFKKRSTAWAVLIITIVCCFFIGQAKKPSTNVEVLPGGVYVQDKANVLSDSTVEYINHMNNGLVSKVGAEIQVATIDTADGKDIFDMAIDLGTSTNLSGNSCVFLIAVDDIDAVIVQGEDIIYAFTDGELSRILNRNFEVSDFEKRKVDTGVKNSFSDLISMYEDYYGITVVSSDVIQQGESVSVDYTSRIVVFVICLIMILIIISIISRPRRGRTVFVPTGHVGRGHYPPRGSYRTPPPPSPTRSNRTTPPRNSGGLFGGSSSRGGGFSSSSSRSSSSRSGGFGSSSRGGSFGSSSRGGGFSSSSSRSSSSRSGGFSSSSRGGSRGGSFKK